MTKEYKNIAWLIIPSISLIMLYALNKSDFGNPKNSSTVPKSRKVDAGEIITIDGDTIKFEESNIRLTGFDTPEIMHSKCDFEKNLGLEAKLYLSNLIRESRSVVINFEQRKDKFGRKLGQLIVDERNVADVLIGAGLARKYSSGKRGSWCK